jgi:hypothetical protein
MALSKFPRILVYEMCMDVLLSLGIRLPLATPWYSHCGVVTREKERQVMRIILLQGPNPYYISLPLDFVEYEAVWKVISVFSIIAI